MPALWDLQQTDDLATIRTPAVRIVFRRSADRWIHEIGPADGPPIAASLESPADSPTPGVVLSPVYQEVQHHSFDDDDRRVRLLLTGLLASHHFSAVLTVSVDDEGTTVDFDVADRCRDEVTSLAATYDVRLGPGELERAEPDSVVWSADRDGSDAGWSLSASEQSRVSIAERGPRSVQAQILATLAPKGVFTHRLRYGWRLATRSGLTR